MKLMKHITIALVLSVIPAMAFGQVGAIDPAMVEVMCPAHECHTATYFVGSGGFVGMATEDNEATKDTDESEVAFIVSCGNVTTRMVAEKDDMGVVRQVFSEENGLACAAGGEINIHRLMPGGWYWINDDMNSAVGSLIPKTVLKNAQVKPFDPGGVTLSPNPKPDEEDAVAVAAAAAATATFVKHEASGRVGILQHILPVPPVAGCKGQAAAASSCVLGAASDWGLTATVPVKGKPVSVAGTTIKRPATADEDDMFDVTVTLVGSNFVLIGMSPVAEASLDGAVVGSTPAGAPTFAGAPTGVTLGTAAGTADAMTGVRSWAVSIGLDGTRCMDNNADRAVSQAVVVSLKGALDGAIPAFAAGKGPRTSFSVTCADIVPATGGLAQQGQELVPDNPFPISE